ncbi:MAG: hypothetical protein RIT27_372 [Pseudomonadota bacterium]|jgi:hypothetical protein
MKITPLKTRKAISLVAASKLAVGIGSAAHADEPVAGLGSKMPAETAPRLGLFELGYPLELLSPPQEGLAEASTTTGSKNATPDANAQQIAKKGRIWTKVIPKQDANGAFPQNTPHPRIDFVVSNIRNDGPVTVYLLYGTKVVSPQVQIRPNAGTFNLDLTTLGSETHILAGVTLQPETKLEGLPPSPFGHDLGPKTRSAVISVALTDLSKVQAPEIYFQAAVVPANGDLKEAQASEIDHFVIERVKADRPNSGSKASKTASSTIQAPDGTTTQQTCGKQGVVAVCANNSTTAPTQTTGSKTTTTQTGSDSGSKTTSSTTSGSSSSGSNSGSKQ